MSSLEAELDRQPLRPFHWRVTAITGLGWMFDAMDVTIISFIVVGLARDWNLGLDARRWVVVMGFIGMFVGAGLAGLLADRYGRKPLLLVSLLVFSVASGLSGFAGSLAVLLLLRFIAGAGLGGELPVASTLVAEIAPSARRGFLVVVLESFWGWGAILAALIAFLLIPRFGWQWGFFAGAVPALLAFWWRRSLPESPRWLLRTGRASAAAQVLREMGISPTGDQLREGVQEVKRTGPWQRLASLWASPLRRRTIMLWILWFGMVYAFYGITAWLPTLIELQGYPVAQNFEAVLITTLAQIPGYLSAAFLVERLGRKWTLTLYLLLYGASALLLGQYGFVGGASLNEIIFWGALVQFFSLGAWGVIYAYTPELYPTTVRSTGAGWAAAVGRLGGIVGPFIVPWLLDPAGALRLDARLVLVMFAIIILLVALSVALLGEETKYRTLEEIAGEARANTGTPGAVKLR